MKKMLEVPILQGGMGVGVSLSGLAGAVAAEGAMGVISSVNIGYREPDFRTDPVGANLRALRQEIVQAKERATERGLVAVNIMVAVSHYEETCRAAIAAGADAIISGAGLPLALAALTEGTETLFAPIVSSARAASVLCRTYWKKHRRVPDFVVLEGKKAGGHLGFSADDLKNGTAKSNAALLPEILSVLQPFEQQAGRRIPVFAAGGVFDADDMASAMAQGAAGVQLATRFIATEECDASQGFKDVILQAKPENIRIIESPVGMPARAVDTPLLQRLRRGDRFPPDSCSNCLSGCKKGNLTPYCISRALMEAVRGNREDGLFFCGENAARVNRIQTVHEVIAELLQRPENRRSVLLGG